MNITGMRGSRLVAIATEEKHGIAPGQNISIVNCFFRKLNGHYEVIDASPREKVIDPGQYIPDNMLRSTSCIIKSGAATSRFNTKRRCRLHSAFSNGLKVRHGVTASFPITVAEHTNLQGVARINFQSESSIKFLAGDYVGVVGSEQARKIVYVIVKNSVAEIIINEPLKTDFHPRMIEIFGINDEALHGIFNVYKCDTMKLYLRTPGARNGNFTGGYISFLVKHPTTYHRVLKLTSSNSLLLKTSPTFPNILVKGWLRMSKFVMESKLPAAKRDIFSVQPIYSTRLVRIILTKTIVMYANDYVGLSLPGLGYNGYHRLLKVFSDNTFTMYAGNIPHNNRTCFGGIATFIGPAQGSNMYIYNSSGVRLEHLNGFYGSNPCWNYFSPSKMPRLIAYNPI
jgi:hypothetical protein